MKANLYALGAIALWACLATLGVALQHVPPLLLTGLALLIGSVWSWPFVRQDRSAWRLPWRTLALGAGTLFGFHFLLFMALRLAPAVEVNLVNYLWPLLIVVLAPFYLPGVTLRSTHIGAAIVGFAGAALAILGSHEQSSRATTAPGSTVAIGYLLAICSALIWANYSLQTKRAELRQTSFPTAAIGVFGLIAGTLSLLSHGLVEPTVQLNVQDWLLIIATGLGPLGAAFYLWDRALKLGDARHIGILSYLTPLTSTVVLLVATGRPLTWPIALATGLIVGSAVWGLRSR